MMAISTGRYTVIRGSEGVNEHGDPTDTDAIAQEALLGSVIERSRSNYDPDSNRIATYRQVTGRFPHGTDIQDGDRVKDESSGVVFLVNSVSQGTTFGTKPDVVVDMERSTA